MKRILLGLINFFAVISIASGGFVNVYTSRHYPDVDQKIYNEFEKETGIHVNVVHNKDASALIKRIETEGKDTNADIFITVGVGDLYIAKKEGILQKINSKKIMENIPSKFRDKDGYWTGLTYRARIIAYNPEVVKESELSTYEDLTNPKWKGKILTRSSTSSYNHQLIAFMIAKNGDKEAKKWVKGIVNNLARDPKGNDREQAKAVLRGEGDIAIMNSYYMGKMSVSKDPLEKEVASKLKIYFPEKTHINLSGSGIVKESKNYENAKKLVEFLTDKFAQENYTNGNFEYPTNPTVKINPLVESWGKFDIANVDFDKIGENLGKATLFSVEESWK